MLLELVWGMMANQDNFLDGKSMLIKIDQHMIILALLQLLVMEDK